MAGGVRSLDRGIKDLMIQKLRHRGVPTRWLMRNLCWSLKLSESFTGKVTESLKGKVKETCLLSFFLIKPLTHQQNCLIKRRAGVPHLPRKPWISLQSTSSLEWWDGQFWVVLAYSVLGRSSLWMVSNACLDHGAA